MAKGRQKIKLELAKGRWPTPVEPQSDECPKVHLSHTVVHTKELEKQFLRASGVRYRCFAFLYVKKGAIYYTDRAEASYEVNKALGSHIMMDSSAFSLHMMADGRVKAGKGRDIPKLVDWTTRHYVDFCRKESKHWDFYVTFDYERKQKSIWEVTKHLESKGLKPIPVYHGGDSLDWLKRWMDAGYTRIGIASTPDRKKNAEKMARYYDQIFTLAGSYPKVKFHGFAVTSLYFTFGWPWDTVDSSSWSRVASLGCIPIIDPARASLASVHISKAGRLSSGTSSMSMMRMSPETRKEVRNQVEGLGFDLDAMENSLTDRFIYSGWLFSHLNKFRGQLTTRHQRWARAW